MAEERQDRDDDEEVRRRLEALERIRQHREEILAERGGKPIDLDVVELINRMRDERNEELFRILVGGPRRDDASGHG